VSYFESQNVDLFLIDFIFNYFLDGYNEKQYGQQTKKGSTLGLGSFFDPTGEVENHCYQIWCKKSKQMHRKVVFPLKVWPFSQTNSRVQCPI
jgi:hypothetical protein